MKVAGLCAICERPGVLHSCALCGRTVCERHVDPATSICASCGGEAGAGAVT